jgi:hypothetical protein
MKYLAASWGLLTVRKTVAAGNWEFYGPFFGAGSWPEDGVLRPDEFELVTELETLIVDPEVSKRGASWLARALGVSDQRARKLLAEGRVRGARKDSATGQWDLSDVAIPRVRVGRRGPGLRFKSFRAG